MLLESGDGDAVLLLRELLEELHCVEGGTLRVESLDHLQELVTTYPPLVDGSDLGDEVIKGDSPLSCAVLEREDEQGEPCGHFIGHCIINVTPFN